MYTVDYAYERCLDQVDKVGSDLFELPKFLNMFKTATYDIIGTDFKFIENTEEIRDDIKTLYRPLSVSISVVNGASICSLPSDYLHMMAAQVYNSNTSVPKVRETRIIRHGEVNIRQLDPHNRPTTEYPILIYFSDYIEIKGNIIEGTVSGSYLKKPTFGENETESIVDLPDQTIEQVLKKVAYLFELSVADERTQLQLQDDNIYRERGKELIDGNRRANSI